MRIITADYIFDGFNFMPSSTALCVQDDGTITDILLHHNNNETMHYKGLLMPGMINAHCHLELSHLKGLIEPHSGLVKFLLSIMQKREIFSLEEKFQAIQNAETEMQNNGIVAIGDISNTSDTFLQKKKNNIAYHTFVECLGLRNDKALEIIQKAKELKSVFDELHESSIVLHAPYSVSDELINLVDKESIDKLTSIHNQESEQENFLFQNLEGDFLQLFEAVRYDKNNFNIEHKTSLQTYLKKFGHQKKIILVHDTFTNKEDIKFALSSDKEIFWCLCPNANLYIENTLPDVELMMQKQCNIVFGTDSYASNYTLSIWDEIKTIRKNFPQIEIVEILKWATSTGAQALGMSKLLGSFSVGKKPGIVLIENFSSEYINAIEEVRVLFKA